MRPTLNLDFANSKVIDPRITVSRASKATYVGADGLMCVAQPHELRTDHDPVTGECKGVLLEENRTNLLKYSENFREAPPWIVYGVTVTPNAEIAPDGTMTATRIEDVSTTIYGYLDQHFYPGAGDAKARTWSIYVKRGTTQKARLAIYGLGGTPALSNGLDITINFDTGVTTGTATNAKGEALSNGWYRLSGSYTNTGNTTLFFRLQPCIQTTPEEVGSAYVWGAQLEAGTQTTQNTGTASGTTTAVILSAGASTDDAYTGMQLFVNGEYRLITDYVGATKTATVAALAVAPTGAYTVYSYITTPSSYIPSNDTFTSRASIATYIGSDGLLKTAAMHEARYQYNPLNLALVPKLLLEGASANLLTYSEQFDKGVHGKWECSVSPQATVAPDGTLTASKLVESAANTSHSVNSGLSVTSGITYVNSCYFKAAERGLGVIAFGSAGGGFAVAAVIVNLSDGVTAAIAGSPTAHGAVNCGNGWWRAWIAAPAVATGTGYPYRGLTSVSNSEVYQGNGTSGLYIWGTQLEAGTQSTQNTGTASGTTTAVILSAGLATDDAYTGMQLFVNGEYRLITDYTGSTKTATVAALTSVPTGAYTVYSYAPSLTSYIPTTTTALIRSADISDSAVATRAADRPSMQGKNFSDWYNPSEGTFVFKETPGNLSLNYVAVVGRALGAWGPRIQFTNASLPTINSMNDSVNVDAVLVTLAQVQPGVTRIIAAAYKTNDYAMSVDSASCVTDTSAVVPSGLSYMSIGMDPYGTLQAGCHISRITYYPKRLDNATLQTLSAN